VSHLVVVVFHSTQYPLELKRRPKVGLQNPPTFTVNLTCCSLSRAIGATKASVAMTVLAL